MGVAPLIGFCGVCLNAYVCRQVSATYGKHLRSQIHHFLPLCCLGAPPLRRTKSLVPSTEPPAHYWGHPGSLQGSLQTADRINIKNSLKHVVFVQGRKNQQDMGCWEGGEFHLYLFLTASRKERLTCNGLFTLFGNARCCWNHVIAPCLDPSRYQSMV